MGNQSKTMQRLQSPDAYFKTKNAAVLAIIKFLEAILAGFAFYLIIINPDAIKNAINSSFEGLSDETQSFHSLFNLIANYSKIILAIELAFIILDGLGAFFMKIARTGAGLVILSHKVRRIFTIIAFLFCAYFFFQFHKAWKEVADLADAFGSSYYKTFTGITSIQMYSAIVLILGSLLLLIDYDGCVSVVMKHVSSEVKEDRLKLYTARKRLGIESAIFAVLLGINTVLSIVSYFGGNNTLAKVNQSLADLYADTNLISMGVGLLLAIKLFFVNRCWHEFIKAHRSKRAKEPEMAQAPDMKQAPETREEPEMAKESVIAGVANKAGKAISEKVSQTKENLAKKANDSCIDLSIISASVVKRLHKAEKSVVEAVDQNGNGKVDIEDIVVLVLKTPGMKIDRAEFLEKQLIAKYSQATVNKAVASSPIKAEVPLEELDQLADACIATEAGRAEWVSKNYIIPESVAIVTTYGIMLRIIQELLYLYGFPDLGLSRESETIDAGVQNILILCIGVIYEIEGADDAIRAVAKTMGTGVDKFLLQKALIKGAIKPVVIKVSEWFTSKLANKVVAGLMKKIPFAGEVLADTILGTGLTKSSFVTSCIQLKDVLRDTYFTRGDIPSRQEEDVLVEMVKAGEEPVKGENT